MTGGQIHDSQPAIALLEGIELENKKVLADKAYSCVRICCYLQEHEAVACIPGKSNAVIKHPFDYELYKQRNRVELSSNV